MHTSRRGNPVRTAVYLSFVTVLVASTAAVAAKYAGEFAGTEVIIAVQFLVCLLLGLPRTLRHGPSG
ncbi:MAG: hypothetical protein AAGI11_16365, partial [Pseudomonadota bacterium]